MKKHRNKKIMQVLFMVYSICMLFLLFGREPYRLYEGYWQNLQWNINLIPFFTIRSQWHSFVRAEYDIFSFAGINLIGNVIMFVPLGFFLPAIYKKLRRYKWLLLSVVGIIMIIEVAQLFSMRGSLDVDDLILNIVGATIGYGIWWIQRSLRKKFTPKKHPQ